MKNNIDKLASELHALVMESLNAGGLGEASSLIELDEITHMKMLSGYRHDSYTIKVIDGVTLIFNHKVLVCHVSRDMEPIADFDSKPDTIIDRPFYMSVKTTKKNGRVVYFDHPECDKRFL